MQTPLKRKRIRIRLFAIAIACFVSLNATSQISNSRELLENNIEEVNKVLPVSVQQGMVFVKKYISENSVYEIHEIDEQYVSFSLFSKKEKLIKKTLLKRYSEDPRLISFAMLVVECNMNIVVNYISKQTKESFQLVLSTKDLIKCLNR